MENRDNAFVRRMQRARDNEFGAMFRKDGEFSPEGMRCGFRGCGQPAIVAFPRGWDEVQYRCDEHQDC